MRIAATERAHAADAAASSRERAKIGAAARTLDAERRALASSRHEAAEAASESSGLKAKLRELQASLQRAALERERNALAAASERALWGGEVAELASVVSSLERSARAAGDGGISPRAAGHASWAPAPARTGMLRGSPAVSALGIAPGGDGLVARRTAATMGARSAMLRDSPASGRSAGGSTGVSGGWLGQSPQPSLRGSSGGEAARTAASGQRAAGGGGSLLAHSPAEGWTCAPEPAWTPYRLNEPGVQRARGAPHGARAAAASWADADTCAHPLGSAQSSARAGGRVPVARDGLDGFAPELDAAEAPEHRRHVRMSAGSEDVHA